MAKILNDFRFQGGFIGERRYNLQDLDHTNERFEEIRSKAEQNNDDLLRQIEALENDHASLLKKHEKVAKTAKQLYEERTNNVGFADRKIQGHINKGLERYDQGMNMKLDELHKAIDDLKEPLDRKILNL